MTASAASGPGPNVLRLRLPDEAATLELGRLLGLAAVESHALGQPPALLLQGGLGSGKTTLVRGLVSALPGSEAAEVSSPSFNIVNLYPTTPPVAHFDLYRAQGQAPEEFLDAVEDGLSLVLAEWIEHLANNLWPTEALHLRWTPVPSGRALEIRALGRAAGAQLARLAPKFHQWQAVEQATAEGE